MLCGSKVKSPYFRLIVNGKLRYWFLAPFLILQYLLKNPQLW